MAANYNPSMQQRLTAFIQNHKETLVLVLTHGSCNALALATMQILNAYGYHFNMIGGSDMTSRDIQWHTCLSASYIFLFNTGQDLRRVLRTHRLDRAALCIQRRYRTHALRALIARSAVTAPPATIEHTQHVTDPTDQNTWYIRPAAGAA